MWKDTNGKTGFKNMRGVKFLYGNMKLLNPEELLAALADGIFTWTRPAPKPETEANKFKKAKKVAKNLIKSRFEAESIKPVDFGGFSFDGGVVSAIELHFLLVLSEMQAEGKVSLPLTNGAVRNRTIAEAKAIVIAVGNDYKDKMNIKRVALRDVNQTTTQGELDALVLPWTDVIEI